jgi:hypothetical protein
MFNPLFDALIMLGCVFAGAMFGLWLQKVLPDHHLAPETKEVVRLATALVATISAMVLGLLVSSAKNSFDRFDDELVQNSARVVMLDRTLNEYGPQASGIRELIKTSYASSIELLFSNDAAARGDIESANAVTQEETIDASLLSLVPDDPVQQRLQERALQVNDEINMTKALIHAQREDSLPVALLVVLAGWLTLIFATFGMFAPRNAVVVGALLACSASAAGAVFLILELNSPFGGLITLSKAPMQGALSMLGEGGP